MRGSNVYFFTLEEERSTEDRASADQQWMHREGTNPTYRSSYGSWISSKMYYCGSCFLWSCFSSQNFGDVFPCTKKSMMKKRYVFAKKNVRSWDAVARSAHDHRIREMARTRPHCLTQTDRIRAKQRSVWGRALELALQVDRSWGNRLSANPHLARRAMAELEKRLGWRDCCSTDSRKFGHSVRWAIC